MNKEKHLKNFGKAQVDNKKKDKKCWHKDCGYCTKYRCKCFNCHTND